MKKPQMVKLGSFREDPDNVSEATDEEIARLAGKLKRVPLGLTAMRIAYVTDAPGGGCMVISGNKRLRVLKQAYGEDGEVPAEWFADVTAMSEAERHEFRLNANVNDGHWNLEKLLAQYSTEELSDAGLDALLADLPEAAAEEGKTDEDAVPDVAEDAPVVSKRGEVYVLGRHRLMCGDSTSAEDVTRLMDGDKASAVLADPPYYMNKDIEGDAGGYTQFLGLWRGWLTQSLTITKDSALIFAWGNSIGMLDVYAKVILDVEADGIISLRQVCRWKKDAIQGIGNPANRFFPPSGEDCYVIGKGAEKYHAENGKAQFFEPYRPILEWLQGIAKEFGISAKTVKERCGVGMFGHWFTDSQFQFLKWENFDKLITDEEWKSKREAFERQREAFERQREAFYAQRYTFHGELTKETDVWEYPTVKGEERNGHPTPKPVKLEAMKVSVSTNADDVVFEPFGGSGTTLIACEQTNRRARLMELDPHYCDVIRRRWAEFVHGEGCDWEALTPAV